MKLYRWFIIHCMCYKWTTTSFHTYGIWNIFIFTSILKRFVYKVNKTYIFAHH